MTKVLTFGWEFPPHISGGLGTACYGLTKALLKKGTEILFVVPRAYGDEEIELVDASEFSIPGNEREAVSASITQTVDKNEMQIISVPSGIHPYVSADHPPAYPLEKWNYVVSAAGVAAKSRVPGLPPMKYKFSGAYGPFLFQEVLHYGEVAASVGAKYDFDLIHAHDWLTYPAGIAAKRVSGKPLIIHVHATEYDRAHPQQLDDRVVSIEKSGLEEADRVVAVSDWTKQILISKYGVSPQKISVIHNGTLPLKALPVEQPSRPGRHIVTFLGRVTYQKGPAYFVEAARLVLKKFPDTHFVVGGSGDLLPGMLEHVAKLKLSSRFHYTGFLTGKQVDQVWSITDIYVMPSVSEPFGITPLEAIQAGVPVIISHQSGVSEVIQHAIKIDFWDVEAIAGAICSVLKYKGLRTALKRESRKAIKELTWARAAGLLTQLYNETHSKKH